MSSATGQELGVVAKIAQKPLFSRFVEFAPNIFVVGTDPRTGRVDAAFAVGMQVLVASAYQKEPPIGVAVDWYVFVGYLPQAIIEIGFRASLAQGFSGVSAACRT